MIPPIKFYALILWMFAVGCIHSEPAKTKEWDYYPFEDRIRKGDLTAFDDLVREGRLDELYTLLHLADLRQFDTQSPFILEKTRRAIISIPGYAVHLGDRIEASTLVINEAQRRVKAFNLLRILNTPEALSQMARFFNDRRNPDMVWWTREAGTSPPQPNHFVACTYLAWALGDKSPTNYNPASGNRPMDEAMQKQLISWWNSPESLPYRDPKTAALTSVPSSKQAGQNTPSPDAPKPQGFGAWLMWACCLLVLAVLSLTAWRKKRIAS